MPLTQIISAWQVGGKTWKLNFSLSGNCQVFTYSKMRGHRWRRVADCWVEASSFHADSQLTTETHLFIAAQSPSHHTRTNANHEHNTYWASSFLQLSSVFSAEKCENHILCSFLSHIEGSFSSSIIHSQVFPPFVWSSCLLYWRKKYFFLF